MMQLMASCSFGLEAVLARELRALGHQQVQSDNGQVSFEGNTADLLRANLWLRTADRVWLTLAEFPASDFEELFQGVQTVAWADMLPKNAEFPVTGNCVKSKLDSVPACQKIVKKAVVESLKKTYKLKWFPEDGPVFPIRFSLVKNRCTVAIDTSGTGLHRRGYRTFNAEAPLRETVAAGLVLLSYWNSERLLFDPFCGSGTILIEAAMIGLDRAPGLLRDFACEKWGFLDRKALKEVRGEAEDRFDRTTSLSLFGSDADGRVLSLARRHIEQAELEDRGIFVQKRSMERFASKKKYAVLITNPPYGERQFDTESVTRLYVSMGEVFRPLLDTWSMYFLSSHADFEQHFGQKCQRRRKLYNGRLAVTYYQYPGPRPPSRGQESAENEVAERPC